MLRFLAIRLAQAVPVLIVMSIITFIIIQAPPGDYGDFIRTNMITQGNATMAAADAAAQAYRESHGLNDPMAIQYLRWVWGIVTRLDFGESYLYNKPVLDVIETRLPKTILIASTSSAAGALAMAVWAAKNRAVVKGRTLMRTPGRRSSHSGSCFNPRRIMGSLHRLRCCF